MNRIEGLVARLLTGKVYYRVDNKIFEYNPPTAEILLEADFFVQEFVEANKFFEWATEEDVYEILGINKEYKHKMDVLSDEIEDIKVDIYNAYVASRPWKILRKALDVKIKQYCELYSHMHSLDYVTLKGYSMALRNQYIVQRRIRAANGTPVTDKDIVEAMLSKIKEDAISSDEYRLVTRCNTWVAYWGAGKERVFGRAAKDLNDEQLAIIAHSKVMDSILKHPDCPDEFVLDTPLLLEGWSIKMNRKMKADKRRGELEKKLPNGGGMSFIVAKDSKEAREIYDMNGPVGAQQVKSIIESFKNESKKRV